jgi:hypothetical protein
MTKEYADAVSVLIENGIEPTPELVQEYLNLGKQKQVPREGHTNTSILKQLGANPETVNTRRPMTGFPQMTAQPGGAAIEPEKRSGLSALGVDANIKILPFAPPLPIWAWLLIAFLIYYGIRKLRP